MELKSFSKKIIFISSGQPSLNPRLVKEADALADAGYQVTVLYAYWNDWGDSFNKQLLPTKKWNAICVGGHPVNSPFTYFTSRFIHKLSKWLFNQLNLNFWADFATARGSYSLALEAKKHKADLYIGHNLGALRAIIKASEKYNAKCGFDAEDFHRQEVSDELDSVNYKIVKYLEDKYYKRLNYLTTSSSQIANAYSQLYPEREPITILNVFPKNIPIRQHAINSTGPVKLFWFSQTIGINRGIEDVAKALKLLKTEDYELHLLGSINNEGKQQFIDNELLGIKNVFFHSPVPPNELINFATKFDIGLASENNIPLNRDICLTNKVFTYLQAGLAIIASDTTAQKNFLEENPDVGKVYQKKDIQSLKSILSAYQADRKMLYNSCKASLKLGQEKLNWENESIKFLSLINTTLTN
ncbi:MAG: hypothetical protein JWR67_1042 [Mucilaginibacter sp.]|nr:hypothetical protein [Mucilaginibacter sp.]